MNLITSDVLRNTYYVLRSNVSFSKKSLLFILLEKLSIKKQLWERKKTNLDIKVKIFGFLIYSSNYHSLIFLIREIFCSEIYAFQSSSQEPVIVDCGANIGMATIYFKSRFPDARILAFEPNPSVYKILEKNVRVNNLNNIELYNLALYDKEMDLQFFIPSYLGTLRGSAKEISGKNVEIKVEAKKLSAYIMKMEKVDLIKIDVEGAESNIIEDLITTNTLERSEQYIVEYHLNSGKEGSHLSKFLEKFESRGYSYSIKANYLKLGSSQDVLLHFYKNPF